MNKIFNTTFEASVRIILLLTYIKTPTDAERIVALDCITIYGKSLGLAEYNLNSNSNRRIYEYTARRFKDINAIKRLIYTGLVKAEIYNNEIKCSITAKGKEYADTLSSEYSEKYRRNAEQIIIKLADYSSSDLIKLARDTEDDKNG